MNSMIHRAIVNSLEKLVVEEGGDWSEILDHIATGLDQPGVIRDRRFKIGHIIQFTGNLTRRTLIEYLRFLKDETSSNLRGKDQIIRTRTIMNDIDLPDMFNNERKLQVTQPVDPTIN
jgi:hypothetical protein